jgi:hypothetical protein
MKTKTTLQFYAKSEKAMQQGYSQFIVVSLLKGKESNTRILTSTN